MPHIAALYGLASPAIDDRMEDLSAAAERLGELELEFRFVDSEQNEEDLTAALADAIALMPNGAKHFRPLPVEQLPNLRLIQTFSAGTDYLDKAMLAKAGIDVANNGGANAVAVAEHAVGLMFAVNRKLAVQIDSVRNGTWDAGVTGARTDFRTLAGKRIGIVGLGRIGSRVAKRLAGWECDLVYTDVIDHDPEYVVATGAARVDLDELLSTSDIVTLHVPLDRTTRRMISDRELGMMKETGILINTCRGPVVDEAALIRALKSKQILGAGLDNTETEPVDQNNPLLQMSNVTLTPHEAHRAIESDYKAAEHAVMNIARVARGEKPDWVVPPV